MSLQKDGDDYTGEMFLDLDARSFQRRIMITGIVGPDGRSLVGRIWPRVVRTFGMEPKPKVKYFYEIITNGGNPGTVGRKGRISAKTLDKRYWKVSR